MKVLIACEFTGVVRDAFSKRGHEAWSCDIIGSERPGNHIVCDVLEVLDQGWDLMIAHPPCTYLANSGVRHLHTDPKRWIKLFEASDFFKALLSAPIERIAIENPIMHKYGKRLIGCGNATQIIQPYQFGHGEQKATCLWLKNLPLLRGTNEVEGREQRIWKMCPSKNRSRERSRTYTGIAQALAEQWG